MDAQKRYSYKAMIKYLLLFLTFNLGFCSNKPYVVVLGIAQDGGSPHTGCEKNCCKNLWESNLNEKVSCIGIVDPRTKKSWIIDATPDFPEQYRILTIDHETKLEGIFLTHAHMGHYTGLMYLGREVMGAKNIPVFAMPRMQTFLESNGPWNQLISLKNIHIEKLKENKEIKIGDRLFIEPFLVPHRDEYSETVGYRIMGENKSLNEARYIHGEFGLGTWTFYGGHDPEDYKHRIGDPKTELTLYPNSPGYRLILNNILFPAAKKKKRKT